jgi:hypothetical protein
MKTIVLVLRSGGAFSFTNDALLIVNHIRRTWKGDQPKIILLWDKASHAYSLGNVDIIPLKNQFPGTWSRIEIYSPEMEQYRPFLYVDLDTAIIRSLDKVFNLLEKASDFIPIEDLWQKGQLATGLAWIPANSKEVQRVWKMFTPEATKGFRMDYYLRKMIEPKRFLQSIMNIRDFKPQAGVWLTELPEGTDVVCFHGKPRIREATRIKWVNEYINK